MQKLLRRRRNPRSLQRSAWSLKSGRNKLALFMALSWKGSKLPKPPRIPMPRLPSMKVPNHLGAPALLRNPPGSSPVIPTMRTIPALEIPKRLMKLPPEGRTPTTNIASRVKSKHRILNRL
ncbi:hypothetical protein EMPG_17635 [Blastomyces silverae]|uniref:Uncharacterized protein n=1 Tax=Blastomyces silverae TaxID=2060906 RepID=A0A0H1BCE6_9EURO|nr:hypothetical protein EMPG_17635 [Blastomyces silverae]